MGIVMLQLILTLCALASSLVFIHGSAVSSPVEVVLEQGPDIIITPTPVPQPTSISAQPPLVIPPSKSAPAPQTSNVLTPSRWPGPLPSPPADHSDSIPPEKPLPLPKRPPFTVDAPEPSTFPSNSPPPNELTPPTVPESAPPNSHQAEVPASDGPPSRSLPVVNASSPRGMPVPSSPSASSFPGEPPSLPPDAPMQPSLPRNYMPVKPILNGSPSSSPETNTSPIVAPPPSISRKTAARPVAASVNQTMHPDPPVSHSQTEDSAPNPTKPLGHPNSAHPPRVFSKSSPAFRSSVERHHTGVHKITPALQLHAAPPTSGSSSSAPLVSSPFASSDDHYSPMHAPPESPSRQATVPVITPKHSPLGLTPRSPKQRQVPPMRALPPPPPHADCAALTCQEPMAYGPPESPCVCVLPIEVGLRLSVALYTFFPVVSELANEVATGVFLKQSQVRIMGANAAEDDPEKTIVLVDLLPLGRKFNDTTALVTFQRFWSKEVVIKTSYFGDYNVLYVRYPGLPPSPPARPLPLGTASSKPYPGHENGTSTMQPLGVNINQKHNKRRANGSILATTILSCLVAVFLLGIIVWFLIFRHRHCVFQRDPTPPGTIHSIAKSSGMPVSMVGSGPSSPTFSLGSSIAACTGSARTFSSTDIERATDFFNETRIIGEGGFGRVYSGILDDGTKVAIKILKKYDPLGSRVFLAEVEMLSRLHHRNLVNLIGICIEDHARCLVYELIPNGSVESRLHGLDKERSPLDWTARLKIALGAARALAYLHEDSCPRVIHRDFKASNILLEDDFTPKVSDFGLARAALDKENQRISTHVMGTFGYLAPEYAMTGHLLVKSEVYSYGVVLLELLTGRKPVDMLQPPGEENLVTWARPLLTNREALESIIDSSLGPDFPIDSITKVAAIASMCVQPEVSHRPFMGEVVQALRLVSNECNGMEDYPSRSSCQEDFSPVLDTRISINSDHLAAALLTLSSASAYDYESDISLSELLNSSMQVGGVCDAAAVSLRRYCSSSGPLRTTGRAKSIWQATARRLSRGSVSEHGVLFRLWPGSH